MRHREDVGLISAVADLRSGALLGAPDSDADPQELLAGIAAAAPELFATDRVSWELIFGRLSKSAAMGGFADLVLVSPSHVHVALRLQRDPYLVLVGCAPRSSNVGLVVSEARARLARFENVEGAAR